MADIDVVIVGAGLAGLVAARELTAAGARVRLLDKGVGPGGRLATHRIDDATLDHGAQFFTVRSDEFDDLVEHWRADGASVERWSTGFAQATDVRAGPPGVTSTAGDGHPRYVVTGGMETLAKTLARGLDVVVDTCVTAIWARDGRWRVAATGVQGMRTYDAAAVLCTAPVPQALALLDRGATVLPPDAEASLRALAYDPCLALLAVVDRDPELPTPGGVQFAEGPVRWLADNARKGVSAVPAVTLHAAGDWSATWYEAADRVVGVTLYAWLAPWLGPASVRTWQVKRWRYSQPRNPADEHVVRTDVDELPIAFAGDAFGHARVEGAARSGLAAAAALVRG
ncbi:MAG: FAD-dependent oxidoreductase [Actinobacteria bacterium]|nr:FAD-dependent oxidoreductase [Actinomycetota bacterium]